MVGFLSAPAPRRNTAATVFAKLLSYIGFYLLIALSLAVSVPLIVLV